MKTFLEMALLAVYFVPACLLMLYGFNLYFLCFLYLRRRRREQIDSVNRMQQFQDEHAERDWPHVVTQLPLYNECNVAERIMRAAAAMDYPADRHTVQVLDDSDDETVEVVNRVADELRSEGVAIEVVRRDDRAGFKAGALAHGITCTDADFFAIFDADFVPCEDFLKKTLPILMMKADVGLVQARWGHLNARESMVTRAQAVGIDGHFAVEQPARAWNGLFMNFNGTAGVWRRQAIDDAGGWQPDTLTEDMDLSYRAQLAGWKPFYLSDVVVPAELPNDINAFKTQQFRWAKGSTQTALKILPRVFRSDFPLLVKLQAALHMTHYLIHPLMVWLALMTLPVLTLTFFATAPALLITYFAVLIAATLAPTTTYALSQHLLYKKSLNRLYILPFLTLIGVGIALSNTRAVLEALAGVDSAFVRTPKAGDSALVRYTVRIPPLTLFELMLGFYCALSLVHYLAAQKYIIGPFLLIYAAGFLFVGTLSIVHALGDGSRRGGPSLANRQPSFSSA